ncbi:MAG: aspartate 1-decarboxylase [Flavobacteriales bacterium]|nr:aspartate 1-decarboxylase [Flavobacteriales bacterium]
MSIEVVRAKIHRVSVTQADLNYIGSIQVDEDLVDAVGLVEGEKVTVLNCHSGARIETYVIKGERGSGIISLNGPAARTCQVGDVVIILSYARMSVAAARKFRPSIIFPDERTNKLKS